MKNKLLIKGVYTVQRFRAKGGWTYISIPEIIEQELWKTGGIKVKGSVDDHIIQQLRLMRTRDMVFLPLSASIRKATRKKEGDKVSIILFEDESELSIPADLQECLEDEPAALEYFVSLTEGYKREYIAWINAAKQPATKAGRISKMIGKLLKKQTLSKPYDL